MRRTSFVLTLTMWRIKLKALNLRLDTRWEVFFIKFILRSYWVVISHIIITFWRNKLMETCKNELFLKYQLLGGLIDLSVLRDQGSLFSSVMMSQWHCNVLLFAPRFISCDLQSFESNLIYLLHNKTFARTKKLQFNLSAIFELTTILYLKLELIKLFIFCRYVVELNSFDNSWYLQYVKTKILQNRKICLKRIQNLTIFEVRLN